jgi:integral membrane protein (TIGR01906 family)
MTGLPLASDRAAERTGAIPRPLASILVAFATVFVLIGLAGIVVATPWYLDGALDRAGSARILALRPEEVHAISSSVLAELFFGPGTFAQTMSGPDGAPVPFFGPSEAAHLRDVQVLARALVLLVLIAALTLAVAVARAGREPWTWRAVSRGAAGLAVGVTLAGAFFAVAFEPAFTLFHVIFFPGGNWSFDPRESRMVQLYPTPFWEELVLVFAVLALGIAVVTWVVARRRAARLDTP